MLHKHHYKARTSNKKIEKGETQRNFEDYKEITRDNIKKIRHACKSKIEKFKGNA